MADKYRIAHDGSDFVVNYEAGGTVGGCETEQAAKQEIEVCERDDFMLQTTHSKPLLSKARKRLQVAR